MLSGLLKVGPVTGTDVLTTLLTNWEVPVPMAVLGRAMAEVDPAISAKTAVEAPAIVIRAGILSWLVDSPDAKADAPR